MYLYLKYFVPKLTLLNEEFYVFSINSTFIHINYHYTVADPGFPIGGVDPLKGGHGPPTWVLFGKYVCEKEKIWSCRGRVLGTPLLDLPMLY